jgi:hypothetical protein
MSSSNGPNGGSSSSTKGGGPVSGKRSIQLSGQTVFRTKPPTNPRLAEKIPCFQWDYSKPMNLFPDTKASFIESSPPRIRGSYQPLNEDGAPLRLNTKIGANMQTSGKVFLQGDGISGKGVTKGSRGGTDKVPGAATPITTRSAKRSK